MKIGIMSEPHLGRARFRRVVDDVNLVESEGYAHWIKSIERVIKESPDIIVISGDVFDSSNPSSLSMSHAISGFSMLRESGAAVYVIGGNHDFSNKNHKHLVHPFKTLESIFTEFTFQYSEEAVVHLSKYVLALVPHQPVKFKDNLEVDDGALNPMFARVLKEVNRTDKKRILVTHGVIESWAQAYSFKGNLEESTKVSNMIVPDGFTNNFDWTIIGHNHQHFVERVTSPSRGDVERISPGSLMDERNSKDNGPCILDIDEDGSSTIKYLGIPSMNTYTLTARDSEDLMEVLKTVEEGHIYLITYFGNWKDVPSDYYEEALSKALYLNIVEASKTDEKDDRRKLKEFWSWVEDVSPLLVQEFKDVLAGREKKGV